MDRVRRYWSILVLALAFVILAAITRGDTGQMQQSVNEAFGEVVAQMAGVVFWEVPGIKVPLVVLVLSFGGIFFTLRFAFINLRGPKHAAQIVSGKYDNPDDPGEVSHFQALSSALSATVGLGNIAGVAVAVAVGGPGAVFWMIVAAIFGMTAKFTESTLGQMYRQVDDAGVVRGGPMVYLREGLAELGLPRVGKALSITFAVLCIGGSFGGGNMFQANQSFSAMTMIFPALGGERAEGVVRLTSPEPIALQHRKHLVKFEGVDANGTPRTFTTVHDMNVAVTDWQRDGDVFVVELAATGTAAGDQFNVGAGAITQVELGIAHSASKITWMTPPGMTISNDAPIDGGSAHYGWLYGLVLALLVGVVIVGGIRRIGRVADRLVPSMCFIYVVSAVAILIMHYDQIPWAVATIFTQAFAPDPIYGGILGVIIQGVRRGAFSNEAGVGSAAIAHAAAKTQYPIREGLVALLEPFIDTVIICFMTGTVIVITGVYADPATASLEGVLLTNEALVTGIGSSYASHVLAVAVALFAFSTMISWSYYGERCWSFLFGDEQTLPYRILFCVFVWLGCVASMGNVLDFSDLMILAMAFPNIIGMVMLSGKVKRALDEYWGRYKAGEFD